MRAEQCARASTVTLNPCKVLIEAPVARVLCVMCVLRVPPIRGPNPRRPESPLARLLGSSATSPRAGTGPGPGRAPSRLPGFGLLARGDHDRSQFLGLYSRCRRPRLARRMTGSLRRASTCGIVSRRVPLRVGTDLEKCFPKRSRLPPTPEMMRQMPLAPARRTGDSTRNPHAQLEFELEPQVPAELESGILVCYYWYY